ncbi:unnamed protein product [Arctia plantaginis]|uniref:Cytochrome P450 n=1 Tax=Arctia plantaginis TaxID=874455 RepID=A0A8S1BAL8_ARCPL|nr:unnamed protein product [Arctia plantaginis]
MQTSKLKPVFRLSSFSKDIFRTIAATSNASDIQTDANLKSWKEIPGPPSLPLIGILHHFLPGGELQNFEIPGVVQRLFDKYGPLIKFEGMLRTRDIIVLGDPETSAYVLRSENWLPIRPGFFSLEHYRKEYKNGKGQNSRATGLITDHGEVWKDFRSTVNPVMLQPRNIKLYSSVLDEVAQDMIKRMKADRDEKNMIRNNFNVEMNLWALESIATVALGCRLNCLDHSLAEDSPAKQLIQCIHDFFIMADKLDFKPGLWRYISTPTYRKAMKLYERQENLTKYFVKKGVEQLKLNANQKSNNEKGVLEKLLEINEEYAYIMASDMLFAGVDTAANTMTATLYLLATHQDKQDKLREEILSKSIKMPYLKACIKEAMRMMPVVSGSIRTATKDYNLMGYKIPKGMDIVCSHREMSLMEKHYLRAQEYIPERWTAEKDDPLYYGNTNPLTFAPFGFGARSCIGRRIAELEIETFLTRVIENFKVEWFGPPPKLVQTSLIHIKGPFNFIFKDAK